MPTREDWRDGWPMVVACAVIVACRLWAAWEAGLL